MNFKELKEKFKDFLIIDNQSINLLSNPKYIRRQISEWKKKKWLVELKRGTYVINDLYFKQKISALYIANKIYGPSYISLEYALSEYELIPETVNIITSVSTRKTADFTNRFGRFSYRKIKKELFFGYKIVNLNNQDVLYATKEKALLDFIYLNIGSFRESFDDFYHYRFQNLQNVSWKTFNGFLKNYKNNKLKRIIKLLRKYLKEENYKEL